MDTCLKSSGLPSDDEECMPKIINTISLQGCSELSFNDVQENEGSQSLLYAECEIKEEITENEDVKKEPCESKLSFCPKDKEEKVKEEKKRLPLTHLPSIKQEKSSKVHPSTSRKDDVVDVKRLALQESLFKTKELFDTFLRVCQDYENSEQMERVVQRMSSAYAATKQEFLGSARFQNLLAAETEKVNTSNTRPWLNLKLVLDELKYNKKCSSKLKLGESEESQDAGGSNDDEPIIKCPKKRRHLKKLEKYLRAINLKIKKLEEREVDWDEEDNSAYCKLDRYRAQFTKIYGKICEIKGKLPDADRPYLRKVSFAGTTYPHINRCIEKFYNKHREFPDFQDIKKLVTLALKQEGIEMQPIKIHSMAAAAFKEFGEMLKRLRQYDDYDVLISYLDQQVDPARDDQQLQDQLNENALLFKKREQEVIDKFAEKESVRDLSSDSGEDSDKLKKKKKIIITNPKSKNKASLSEKPKLSSAESADEETVKSNAGYGLSSDSESDSEENIKKQSVKDKGKALLGKQSIVKKGVKKSSLNKFQPPKTSISSDEESDPGDTKESLTNYLGLKGKGSPNSTASKESKHLLDSEDEVAKENKKPRPLKGSRQLKRTLSGTSDKDQASKSKLSTATEENCTTNSKNDSKIKTIADSDSDIEHIAIANGSSADTKVTKKRSNQARKRTGGIRSTLVPKKPVDSKRNTHEIISDNSESESRTTYEESDSAKKNISDVNISSDSSDEDVGKKEDLKDDTIIVLSEDVIVEDSKPITTNNTATQVINKLAGDSSDDDICILSQVEVERRTVAPRKIKPNSSNAPSATSTPNKNSKLQLKRRMSNQQNSGRSSKMPKLTTNPNNKQTTLPQVINGASRKVLLSRVTKSSSSSGANTPEHIPLIEID